MKKTEKVLAEFERFLDEHMEEGKDIEELGKEFMKLYNHDELVERELTDEQRAQELVYEISDCRSEKEMQTLLHKILELDPENLDALFMNIEVKEDTLEVELEKLLKLGERKMKEKGFMKEDAIGHFWGMLETRPFMRIKKAYLELLYDEGKYRVALQQAKEMLELNEHDNLGIRYHLMAIYANLQMEEEAEGFFGKWDEPSAFMFLPLIILKYQLNKKEDAIHLYEEFQEFNKNCKKVFKKKAFDIDELDDYVDLEMYAPFSEEEIYLALQQNINLLIGNMSNIMKFLYENLKKGTTKKKSQKKILS